MKNILVLEDIKETRDWLVGLVVNAFSESRTIAAERVSEITEELLRENLFDLALLDLGLPDGSGLETLRKIRSVSPQTVCVVVTAHGDDSLVVAALSAGAEGYLLKDQPPGQILVQLRDLSHGLPAMSPSIARRLANHFSLTGPSADDLRRLTARETEILSLISRGHRNADVSSILGIAQNTVAVHIKSIYRKLAISSRSEAAWHATRLGL